MKKGSMANSEANIPDWEVNNFTNDNDSALKVLKIYFGFKKTENLVPTVQRCPLGIMNLWKGDNLFFRKF